MRTTRVARCEGRGRFHSVPQKSAYPRPVLRVDGTPAERKLWYEFLRSLPSKFTRQKPLGPYIADFYCSASRLVIELDGDSHFNKSSEAYDAARSVWLQARGIEVLRFTNADVMENFEGVCSKILSALNR